MGELDEAMRLVLWREPQALVSLLFGPEVRVVGTEDTEAPVLRGRPDKLLRLRAPGRRGEVRCHVEIQAVWESDLPARMHEYWTLGRLVHEHFESVLLVLKRGKKKGAPRDRLVVRGLDGETQLEFRYRLLCAWHRRARQYLEGPPGWLPLVPFAPGAQRAHVVEAAERIRATVRRGRAQADLLAALETFAESALPRSH